MAARHRKPGDTRPLVADYILKDFTLRMQRDANRLDIACSVRNLFDVTAREPSPRWACFRDFLLAQAQLLPGD